VLRVTADTNVVVSGLISPNGKPRELLQTARNGEINLTLSHAILEEAADVLSRKFDWPPEDIAEARQRLSEIARIVTPAVLLEVIKEDPSDNRILECAVSAGSGYIVTGDKHLLRLGVYSGIRILKVSDFLNLERDRIHEP
jgi:putative PIN family toxin of toxin-antitoxin system